MAVTLKGKVLAGFDTANRPKGRFKVDFVFWDDHVRFRYAGEWGTLQLVPISDVGYIAYEDGGATTNVAAVAAFGVLGLGAQRAWTMVTFGLPDSDAVIAVKEPVPVVRATLLRALEPCPSLEGRIVDGPPRRDDGTDETATHTTPTSASVVDRLERLAGLLKEGMIDEEEYTRLKTAVIDESP